MRVPSQAFPIQNKSHEMLVSLIPSTTSPNVASDLLVSLVGRGLHHV